MYLRGINVNAMRAVVQRVRRAGVSIGGRQKAAIGVGVLVLLGVEGVDTEVDAQWLARKICALRIFDDGAGVMNRSLLDIGGDALVVSQGGTARPTSARPGTKRPSPCMGVSWRCWRASSGVRSERGSSVRRCKWNL